MLQQFSLHTLTLFIIFKLIPISFSLTAHIKQINTVCLCLIWLALMQHNSHFVLHFHFWVVRAKKIINGPLSCKGRGLASIKPTALTRGSGQENSIRVPAWLCLDSYTTLHGLCTTFTQVLYNSFYDPTTLSYQTMENLIYNSRYGSATPFLLSETKSSLSSVTSTILGTSFSSEYISYNSSMGSSWFMTQVVEITLWAM